MDFGIDSSVKQEMLSALEKSLSVEIYSLLIRLGVDPDTFSGEDDLPSPEEARAMIPEIDRLRTQLASLALVRAKLA